MKVFVVVVFVFVFVFVLFFLRRKLLSEINGKIDMYYFLGILTKSTNSKLKLQWNLSLRKPP